MVLTCEWHIDYSLLVPNVQNKTVTNQTNSGNETIDQTTEEKKTLTGNFKLSPMTWDNLLRLKCYCWIISYQVIVSMFMSTRLALNAIICNFGNSISFEQMVLGTYLNHCLVSGSVCINLWRRFKINLIQNRAYQSKPIHDLQNRIICCNKLNCKNNPSSISCNEQECHLHWLVSMGHWVNESWKQENKW